MKYLVVDTNILLRLADRSQLLHPTVRQAIRQLKSDQHQLCITPQNCAAFWNVATRPATRNGFGLSPAQADQQLKLIERLFLLLPESPEIYKQWRRLVVQSEVSGVQVHDAKLVAAMKAHGITHILTLNSKDFNRYEPDGIIAVNPSSNAS